MKIRPLVFRNGVRNGSDEAETLRADSLNLSGHRADVLAGAMAPTDPQAAQAPHDEPVNIGPTTTVWINEIHYDNSGTDTNEGIEIAGVAGTDLTGWTLVPYNGGNGASYTPAGVLSGTIPNQQNGFGTVYVAISGLQNGAPDAIALVDNTGTVVQFLSYEGSFTATNGAASGMTSVDIGVLEDGTQTDAFTLQLQGSGSAYADFTWGQGVAATRGAVNTGQTFVASGGTPALSINDVAIAESDSGTVTLTFTVSLSAPAGVGGVTFDIATADNSATTADNDYAARTLTSQTIPEGSQTYTFDVTVNGDDVPEANETFFVNVTNVTGATVSDGQGQGTITNDDAFGSLAINDVTLAEGNSGTTNFTFTVTRSGGDDGTVSADYTVTLPGGVGGADGTDVSGTLTGTVTFLDGETSKAITVTVNGDAIEEPNETFTVALSNPQGGVTISDGSGLGTITNDDSPPVGSINDVAVAEGADGVSYMFFTVTLDHSSTSTFTFNYATAEGAAAAGSD
jgi:hypothetical protein